MHQDHPLTLSSSNLEILKFFDLVEVLFLNQHSNRDLPEDLLNTLNLSKTSH